MSSSLFSTPRFLEWYFRFVLPLPLAKTTLEQEIQQRRAYVLSSMSTLLILVLLLLLPATLFIPNRLTFFFCVFLWLFCILCLALCRRGKVLLTSYLLVCMLEITLMGIIVTTRPFDSFNLPLLDFFALIDLLAISLLSWRAIIPLVGLNTLFTIGIVLWQPQTANLLHFSRMPFSSLFFYNIVVRPTAIQVVAIVVPLLWIQASTRAWSRLRQAELEAEIERTRANEQQLLEQDIQQLLLLCLQPQSSPNSTYLPQSQGHKLLLSAFSILRERLLQAQQVEETHRRLVQAIHQASLAVLAQQPVSTSGTLLDLFTLALRQQSETEGHLFPPNDLLKRDLQTKGDQHG